ncbi:hypothetical protein QJ856_gp1091 [Tupanvirus deep ocean]|uniref:Uncharacterized protein n=2 Tax=Tupanvirus TaxID=2094720 RepID=A0AC62A7F7_9VIRU|nr:hypothetical protein QJ856_gp1091 [Tupanvirus deep ocean]QKU33666.1 hypothetical protein [Tupanvirus deep ocean]
MIKSKVELHDLYQKFFGKNLVHLERYIPKTPTKKQISKNNSVLTPISKSIYDTVSPRSKPYILQDLLANNKVIEETESKLDELDLDYQEKLENNGLGFFMENVISVYGLCPVCGQRTLRKYEQSNVPVVDLVCINHEYHLLNNKCFIFQIKISLTNNYFSLRGQNIVVGSKSYGEPAHIHKGTDDPINKLVVPGYICIKLNPHATNIQTYTIDHRNSFVLVPDYNNTSDDYYYNYRDFKSTYGKDIITWNGSMVSTLPLNRVLQITTISYEVFSEDVIENPYTILL